VIAALMVGAALLPALPRYPKLSAAG